MIIRLDDHRRRVGWYAARLNERQLFAVYAENVSDAFRRVYDFTILQAPHAKTTRIDVWSLGLLSGGWRIVPSVDGSRVFELAALADHEAEVYRQAVIGHGAAHGHMGVAWDRLPGHLGTARTQMVFDSDHGYFFVTVLPGSVW